MTFEDFDTQLFDATKLRAIDRGAGHWQIKLDSGMNVNYYPNSSNRTFYVNPMGTFKGLRAENMTEFMAITLVQDLQKQGVNYESASIVPGTHVSAGPATYNDSEERI